MAKNHAEKLRWESINGDGGVSASPELHHSEPSVVLEDFQLLKNIQSIPVLLIAVKLTISLLADLVNKYFVKSANISLTR